MRHPRPTRAQQSNMQELFKNRRRDLPAVGTWGDGDIAVMGRKTHAATRGVAAMPNVSRCMDGRPVICRKGPWR